MRVLFFSFLLFCTLSTEAIVIPNKVYEPILNDFDGINADNAAYTCPDDHQAQVIKIKAKQEPPLGATIYAFSYREYARRIKSVKDGYWKVTRVDSRGLRFVKRVSNGRVTGKEYMLDRFSYFDKISGTKSSDGKCFKVGKMVYTKLGDPIGKVIAIGDHAIAMEYKGGVEIEPAWIFKQNCK